MQGSRKRGARSFKNWGWHEFPTPSEWYVSSILGNADTFVQISTVALYVCVYICVYVYVYRKGVLNYILQYLFIIFYPQYILILSPVLSES